jgi:SAM-dependent methyltransferase
MDKAEFDKFADEYEAMLGASLTTSGEGAAYFAEYKIKDIVAEYFGEEGAALKVVKVLDFGSGNGGSIPFVQKLIPQAELTCVDVSERSLEIAQRMFPDAARFVHFDGVTLPFGDGSFDIAYAACVFHHIDITSHVRLLTQLHRILRPGGCLFIFEHNPYNPLTVHVVNNCPFDENARLIRGAAMKKNLRAAGFTITKLAYRIFFPHGLRIFRPLEKALTWLPLGGQYYVLGRK